MWVRVHSRLLKVVPCESLVSYSPSVVTMAVSLTISEIFSVKQWSDLEIWVWGSFKVIENGAVWQTIYDFLLVCHCNYLYLVPFASYLTSNNCDLEIWLRGHRRSLTLLPIKSLGAISYLPSIITKVLSLAISKIFSVKEWPELEIWVWGSSRSLKLLPFESLGAVSYSSVVNMAVTLAVCDILSVKELRDLENWVRGHSRSLKMTLFDRPNMTFYWSAIVTTATRH